MAYDPNSAYEPPRRMYYAQQPQSTPQQATYGPVDGSYDQYGEYNSQQPVYPNKHQYDPPYDRRPNQAYDQSYGHDGYQQDVGYDQDYDRGRQHNGAYHDHPQLPHGSQQRPPLQDHGQYGGRDGQQRQAEERQQGRVDRSDDPRYQPRTQPRDQTQYQDSRGPTTLNGQQPLRQMRVHPEQQRQTQQYRMPPVQGHQERPPPRFNAPSQQRPGNYDDGSQLHMVQQARDPRLTQQRPREYDVHAQSSSIQQGYGSQPVQQRPGVYHTPAQANSAQRAFDGRPAQPPQPVLAPQQRQEPPKDRMAEWKAREKAKMNAALSPETIAQDNAFPTFPNSKKTDRSTDRSGGESAMSHRSNETIEQQRPFRSRENSANNERVDSKDLQHVKPQLEGRIASPEVSNRWPLPDGRPSSNRSQMSPQRAHHTGSGQTREQWLEQWPIVDETSNERVQHERQPPDRPVDNVRAMRPQQQLDYGTQQPYRETMSTSGRARPSGPPPIMTHAAQQPQSYVENQAFSPSIARPHPTASQPPQPSQNNVHPISPASQRSEHVASPVSGYAAPKSWMRQPAGPQPTQNPKTREEQIEDDMPDFDFAARAQPSTSHKRNQTVDRHLNEVPKPAPPPMPAMPSMAPHRTDPGHAPNGTHSQRNMQRHFDESTRPHAGGPDFQRLDQRPAPPSNDYAQEYDFGSPYQSPEREQGYEYDGAAMPPPQAPLANGQSVRRSADDTRQMPHRPAGLQQPGPQSFSQPEDNGYPGPQSPSDTQQRPELDRVYTNQTVQSVKSDPGQQRFAGTPPIRPGLQAPPAVAPNGQPLVHQRSAPGPSRNRPVDPDALPHHPAPVRAGLQQQVPPQQTRPPPVRNYHNVPTSASALPATDQRQASGEQSSEPVTHAQLDQLRANAEASHSPKQALLYAKKLAEAASVLASDNGRADAKTTAKNREKYLTDAYKRVKKLVQAGYPEAQFYLADCYGQGALGLAVDAKEAFQLYQAAAKAGHAQAAYRTAVCCEMGADDGGGTRRDPAKAVQWYRRAATLGDGAAMYKLGVVLLKGLLGEQRSVGEAVTWLTRAVARADREHPHALHELAALYDAGSTTSAEVRNKVVADDAHALALFQQAAQLGYKFSQFRLGQAYEYGQLGLAIDHRLSITWYTRAAAQGEHQAELALSGWYLTGADGILAHDDTEAFLWARKAAMSEPPLAKAMFAMGYFAEKGIGCPMSAEEAKKWYSRAASYRFPKALERLEELKKNGGKAGRNGSMAGKLSRKDQKRDEAECVVM